MSGVLTFDLGTSYFKACIFDECLKLRAVARAATPIDSPSPEKRQISPVRFFDTLLQLTAQLRQQSAQAWRCIDAITFATQTNSFLCLDRSAQPLTPLILWNDLRAAGSVDRLRLLAEAPGFYQQTGVPEYSAGFMPAKLLWLRAHQPDALKNCAKICLISDYLTLLLTGEHVTEAGAAGLTGLLDIHQLEWRSAALEALQMQALGWPRVVRAGTLLGQIRGPLAQQLGLPAATQFVAGCLDQYAGAMGAGNVVPGRVSETTGTVLATVCLSGHFDSGLQSQGVFQGPAFAPGLYYRMLFSGVSAYLLEVFRREAAPEMTFAQLDGLAAEVAPGCNGLRLDPAASLAQSKPVFNQDETAWPLNYRVRAILEGVAAALCSQVQRLVPGGNVSGITSAGGAARSELWRQIKADALGFPVHAVGCAEPTSLGVAALARAALTGLPLRAVLQLGQ